MTPKEKIADFFERERTKQAKKHAAAAVAPAKPKTQNAFTRGEEILAEQELGLDSAKKSGK
jgi:hypothetical protein